MEEPGLVCYLMRDTWSGYSAYPSPKLANRNCLVNQQLPTDAGVSLAKMGPEKKKKKENHPAEPNPKCQTTKS